MELTGADGSSGATLYLQIRGRRTRWATYRVQPVVWMKVPQVWLRLTKKKDASLPILGTDT